MRLDQNRGREALAEAARLEQARILAWTEAEHRETAFAATDTPTAIARRRSVAAEVGRPDREERISRRKAL